MAMQIHISLEQHKEILRLKEEGYSGYQISKMMKIPKSTVYRHLKKKKDLEENPTPPPPPITQIKKTNPANLPNQLQYKIQKLEEVRTDMVATRSRGSVHVLPTFHRLEMEIYDQIDSIINDENETSVMSAEECISTIIAAATQLPPLLREKLIDELSIISNVIPLKNDA